MVRNGQVVSGLEEGPTKSRPDAVRYRDACQSCTVVNALLG